MEKMHFKLTTSQIILFGFLSVILTGSLLLSLPISTQSGVSVSYIDALFTATTATCVTGLVTLPTVTTWSFFGQAVILCLIQVGGLGVITILSWIMILIHKKIGIENRLLIQDAFNLNTLSGLVRFVKKVIKGTFLVESIGALLYLPVFVKDFGLKGIWISIFNSVSAFCNAGIDVIAENSLCNYTHNTLVNVVTMSLIVLGGLGYIVWWDVLRVLTLKTKQKNKLWNNLTLHSKIAIFTTLSLILFGACCYFIFEFNNPLTMKDFTIPQKIQASFFQSVTTRTAGFATIAQENLTNASSIISLLLMFIGGSPVGTAGGIKTVTIIVLVSSAISVIKNKNDANLFSRRLSSETIRKAVAVVMTSFTIAFTSTILLSAVLKAPALDIMYESVSATATVGLSRNLTSSLNTLGKIIIIFTMYFGRVGPISLAFALKGKNRNENLIKNPTEEISVG